MTKQQIRIGIGLLVGFVVGMLITALIIHNPHNLLGSFCLSGLISPICALIGGLIGGFWKDKA